jgi:hypothetical protein
VCYSECNQKDENNSQIKKNKKIVIKVGGAQENPQYFFSFFCLRLEKEDA